MNELTLNIPTAVLTLTVSIVVGMITNSLAVKRERERYNRIERRQIYKDFLKPYAIMLAQLKKPGHTNKDITKSITDYVSSEKGRMNQIEHVLIGTDESVRAFNNIMLASDNDNALDNLGNLILAIRKGFVGQTRLTAPEALQFISTEDLSSFGDTQEQSSEKDIAR